jgi:dephospho-CoA kinase
MLIIIVTGLARSGKDTVADYLARKHGFEKVTYSDFLAKEIKKKGLSVSKKKMAELGDKLRKEKGMHYLSELVWKKIQGKKKAVLVGPRSKEEIEYIKQREKNVFLVNVSASLEKRFNRRSPLDPQEKKGFLERDRIDIERKGLGKVIKMKDFEIENNAGLNELFKETDKVLQKIYKAV